MTIKTQTVFSSDDAEFNSGALRASLAKCLHQGDAPVITGDAKYSSPLKLWNAKTNRVQPDVSREDIDRSQKLKPVVRELIENQFGIRLQRHLMIHSERSFIYSTFDGFNENTGEFWLIKTPRVRTHQEIHYYEEIVPRYKTELLQQQLVARSNYGEGIRGWLASFVAEEALCEHYGISDVSQSPVPTLIILPFEFEAERLPKLLEAECAFWQFVESDKKPIGFPKTCGQILGKGWRWI